jgi:hypothetical protein
MHFLSICTIAKDEDLAPDATGKTYIDHFVDYHRFIGVDHFYIYDQGQSLFKRFAGQHDITVLSFPYPGLQAACYAQHITHTADDSMWTTYLDVDEFLVPEVDKSIKEIIQMYASDLPDLGALQINWKCFGSNGHLVQPALTQFEAYTRRENELHSPLSRHTKCIVKRGAAKKDYKHKDPHHFIMNRKFKSYNVSREPVWPSPFVHPVRYTNLSVAHYMTRSKEEFITKCRRGRVDIANTYRDIHEFELLEEVLNAVEDNTVLDIYSRMVSGR